MDPSSILTSIIEVAIGIAGFSGIVVAIARGNDQVSEVTWFYLSILLGGSAVAIVASYLPLLLISADVADPGIWIYPSGLLLLYQFGRNIHLFLQMRRRVIVASFVNYAASFLTILVVGLCIANIFVIKSSWPYLTSMVLILLNAGLAFLALLNEVFRFGRKDDA